MKKTRRPPAAPFSAAPFDTASRREFLKTAGRSALVLGAASFSRFGAFFPVAEARGAESGGPVTAGIMAPSHCAAPYAYAKVKETFAKNGVDVSLKFYKNMADIARDLIAGDIQVGQLISPLFLAIHFRSGPFRESGVPLVTPMFTGTNGGAVVVGADSPARSLEDLGGMTIGSHSKLTIHYLLMMNYIARMEKKLSASIRMEVIDLPEMIGSLASGKIQAFIMPEPINAVAEAKGVGRVVALTKDLWPGHPCCLMAATRTFAEKRPEALSAVALSVMESALFAGEPGNRPAFIEGIRNLEPYGKLNEKILARAFAPGRADFAPFPYRSAARSVALLMRKLLLLPSSAPAALLDAPFRTDIARPLFAKAGGTAPESDFRKELVFGQELSFD